LRARSLAAVVSARPGAARVAGAVLFWLLEYWGCLPRIKGAFEDMAKTSKKVKRTPSAAFMKPVTPDEKLAKVVGDKPLPRTELTKKIWAYIRKNGLQDAKKRTFINADENLKAVFNGKKQVSMFEMTKLASGHLKK
jgi:upstream activation factor subunit UAF30